jgi:hypothetical protein
LNRQNVTITRQAHERRQLDHYRREDGYLASFGAGEGFVIEARARDQFGDETRQLRGFAFRPAVKADAPLRIDGQLADWSAAVPLYVPPEGRLNELTFFVEEYGGDVQWQGRDDFSAAWQMMWDEACLYLAVRTFDEHVTPQHSLGRFWNGDTFSVQIDPQPAAADASPLPTPRDVRTVHTFDIGRNDAGPQCRRKYATPEKAAGDLATIQTAIRAVSNGLVYEIAIPWEELAPLSPEIGGWMGLSLVFYEDDGAGRETYYSWFGGAGGNGLAREPRLMGDIHFVP